MVQSTQAQLPEQADEIKKAGEPENEKPSLESSRDASYEVCYNDEGVYLEITREREDGGAAASGMCDF